MGKLAIKEKEIVVPGDDLAEGMDYLPGKGTYRNGNKITASRLGLASIDGRAIKIIPLSGKYVPKRGDTIIGTVIDVTINGWRADINCAYSAMLSMKDATTQYIERGSDLTKYFDIGDSIVATITNVTSQKLIDLTMKGPGLRKLSGERIIKVNPNKVPRIIGKQGSMVTMIKQYTNCRITVGQNGVIWIEGEPKDEILAVNSIKKIENESHIPGLTEDVEAFLKKNSK